MIPTPKNIPNTTRVVVFDLDGTLYDKHKLSFRMVCHAICDIPKMQAERETRASMKGIWIGNQKQFYNTYFRRLSQRLHCSADSAQVWYQNRYMPLMVKTIGKYQPLGKWVLPFINACKAKNIKLVVLSDYGHAKEKLQVLGLSVDTFDWVISAPELGGLKPASQLIYKVAEYMQVTPRECLVIGDREDTDGDMARATGADFIKVEY